MTSGNDGGGSDENGSAAVDDQVVLSSGFELEDLLLRQGRELVDGGDKRGESGPEKMIVGALIGSLAAMGTRFL